MDKQFTMSMYASVQDLYEAKSKYYMEQCEQLQKENDELMAHVELLKIAIKAKKSVDESAIEYVNRTKAQVEEETIERGSAIDIVDAPEEMTDAAASAFIKGAVRQAQAIANMTRKYKEQSDED